MAYFEHIPTASDVNKLRSGKHTYDFWLNAAPKTVVATARVNQTSFTYPLAQITVNETIGWSDVKEGMAVWIGTEPGTYDVTAGVIRSDPFVTTLFIDAKSLGDSGYSRNIYKGLANDYYVTVLKHRPLWGFLSSIRGGVFYKKWDKVYTEEGSSPNPLVSLGKHRRITVNDDGYAIIKWDAVTQNWGAKTTFSQQWTGDTGEIIGGDEFSDTITSRYTPGWYVIEHTVLDSDSKIGKAFRYLWVNPRGDVGEGRSFGSQHVWTIEDDKQDKLGREMVFNIMGDLTSEDIYPGQPFLFTEDAYYNGVLLDDPDVAVNNFIGYTSEFRPMRASRTSRVGLTVKGPMGCAKVIPAAVQIIQEVASPTSWTEATQALSNPIGAMYYIVDHHCPTLFRSQDFEFDPSVSLNREQVIKLPQDNIASQMTSFEETMPGVVGSRSDGTIVCVRSPMHMSNEDRNLLNTKFTWVGGDLEGRSTGLRYLRSLPLRAGQVKCFALAYEGGDEALPYASLAPGKVQAQGTGKPQYTFILPYSNPSAEQTRLNELSGHTFAIENADINETDFRADRNIDICEPVDANTWHKLEIDSSLDPLGIGFDTRCIPVRVRRKYQRVRHGWVKTVDPTMQIETFGQPGVTIPVERGEWENWVIDGFNLQVNVEFDPVDDVIDDDDEGVYPSGPDEYLVNFNNSGWQDYDTSASAGNEQGIVGGGNIGRCFEAAQRGTATFIGQGFTATVQVSVNLDVARTVTEIEIDYHTSWSNYTPADTEVTTSATGGSFFDNEIVSNVNGGWRVRLFTGLSDAGVINLVFILQVTGAATTTLAPFDITCKVDNIRIKCEPL